MSGYWDDFWSSVPEKAFHPARVQILEVFVRIGEPLSAVGLVDVLDGEVTMWETARHLKALEALGVVERVAKGGDEGSPRGDGFDVPYGLEGKDPDAEE